MFLFSSYYVEITGELAEPSTPFEIRKYYNQPIKEIVVYLNDILKGLVSESTQKVDMLFTQTVGEPHNQ